MSGGKVKCVVWDLDNTLWDGTLIENDDLVLRDNVVSIIEELDRRGILQSISSKNDSELAKNKLIQFNLWDYFIYPQINWNSKSEAIFEIAKSINIGTDAIAFVDDQQFEREEVLFHHPNVFCIDAKDIDHILDNERLKPKYITNDSKNRRRMYQNDIERNCIEKEFTGTKEDFLKTLSMVFTVTKAEEEDLKRVEELTVRTHQLNSTGYTYSYEELKRFVESDEYEVLIVQLDDKFGEYGKIGLALIEKQENVWQLNLLLMSCRVMSKGVGNVLLNYIFNKARKHNARLRAQFVPTDRNRVMYITYKFNGFKEIERTETVVVFEADMSYEREMPDYISLVDKGGL